ncbi:hypothetical protein WA026_002546 [Henosepilachna vigintioctopunctata]|uniref:Uncharacterized protein n=1 Tax=Henosepilachna vigintioctopunctata TaxID=420089 RepID=A0AAW1U0P4_9CUCU
MKIFALCFLAFVAGALADCGCLKCNPNLRVVSLANAPVKVIFRDGNRVSPYREPYTLQTAIPAAPRPFVPNEYDYQLQVVPVGSPGLNCGGSTYNYDLQTAVLPPEPLVAPLMNLKTNTERIVLDSPYPNLFRGSTCNTGSPCPALEGRPLPPLAPLAYDYKPRGPTIEYLNTCRRYAHIFSNNSDAITRRNTRNFSKCRQKRDLIRRKNEIVRRKRDILELPMNFMFKFLPNLFKGPILNVLHAIQYNANPAVIRARVNANKNLLKSQAAKVKLKNKYLDHNFKDQALRLNLGPNQNLKQFIHSPHNIGKISVDKKESNKRLKMHSPPKVSNNIKKQDFQKQFSYDSSNISTPTIEFWKDLIATLLSIKHQESQKAGKKPRIFIDKKYGRKIDEHPQIDILYPTSKNIFDTESNHETNDILVQASNTWKDFLATLKIPKKSKNELSKVSSSRKPAKISTKIDSESSEVENLLSKSGYTADEIRNDLLEKLKSFNEVLGRTKRSPANEANFELKNNNMPKKHAVKRYADIHNGQMNSILPTSKGKCLHQLKSLNETFKRKRRSILLGKDEFSLPFFEIQDDVLDNATNGFEDSEEIVGSHHYHNERNHKSKYENSENDYDDEILGHSFNDHPFVVLLRAPLQFLQQFQNIRKNFQPILYGFPKLLQSSRKYLRDLGKNFQTGVLDFASNIIGDFDNSAPLQHLSFLSPKRPRRNIDQKSYIIDYPIDGKHQRQKRYILKVVDEGEVQEFLEEKLGGYFDDDNEEKERHKNNSEEEISSGNIHRKNIGKKFIVRKLSPKVILDNNGKAFVEINGNKRPLFSGKHHHATRTSLEKSDHETDKETSEPETKNIDPTEHDINNKIDEVIEKAKRKLKGDDILESSNSDEMPTQTVKEKIFQISADIQNLINLNFCEYNEIYEGLLKLENLRKLTTEYWKNVMINEKTNDIRCKIRILNYFREMQNEKDSVTKRIVQMLKTSDKFIVKKMIKLLVRLQKLQCLIQKVVDHFDNRMKIGTISDTEREIKFVDYLSTLNFVVGKSKEDVEYSLNKDKNEALERGIRLLENLRVLLQKDDTYTINEIAKQIWEMKNIEKLQHDTIDEMNKKLEENMKIRKELKILFDLLKQIEASEDACGKLLTKYDNHLVGSKSPLSSDRRLRERQSLAERLLGTSAGPPDQQPTSDDIQESFPNTETEGKPNKNEKPKSQETKKPMNTKSDTEHHKNKIRKSCVES